MPKRGRGFGVFCLFVVCFLKLIYFYFTYVSVLPALCAYALNACSTRGGQKRSLEPLELMVQMVMSVMCVCWDLNPGPL